MTLQERRAQGVAIRHRIRSLRVQLGFSLGAMDYEQALACQMKIDGLKREARCLARRDGHELYAHPLDRHDRVAAIRIPDIFEPSL